MTGAPSWRDGSRGILKVLYLLAVTAAVFALPAIGTTRPARWYVLPPLFLLQLAILVRCGIPLRAVARSASRLKWLFAILVVCYAFLPSGDRRAGDDWRWVPISFGGKSVVVNLGGLSVAALMCVQIVTVILASAVVRLTGSGTDLVDGLRVLGLPTLFVHSLDQTLGQFGGAGRPGQGRGGERGDGSGRRREGENRPTEPRPAPLGFFGILRRMARGDLRFFIQAVRGSLEQARYEVRRDNYGRLDERLTHDVAVVTGIALVMGSLKIVETLPGVPFAPGHKTLLLYPLYILAARMTHTRWGGTAAGAVMGVIGFLQGNGRFGVLDVLRHLAPGVVIDLLMPIAKRLPQSAAVYCVLGFFAAVARTATEFAVVGLLEARVEVYLFPATRLIPNLIAGTLSGFVTVYVLKAFPPDEATDSTAPAADRAIMPTGEGDKAEPLFDPSSRPDLVAIRPAEGGGPHDGCEEDL